MQSRTLRRSLHLLAPAALPLALVLALATGLAPGFGCADSEPDLRPSLLLVVMDTLRADAVSSMGAVAGTTPHLDALAAEGLLYARAHTPAPWTLPAHTSLFTGLLPHEHGVAVSGTWTAPESATTLAEYLVEAGYQTLGFSENPFVSATFGLSQGFEQYGALESNQYVSVAAVRELIDDLAADLDPNRPFFLFLNFLDAHEPYMVREENPFAPTDVKRSELLAVDQSMARICNEIPPESDLQKLKGLYLGEVAAADAKLGAVRDALVEGGFAERLVTVVTSDHGQHFGEHRLQGHQWSVRSPLLHVPLVVHGLPGVAPARITEQVDLVDVLPSALAWLDLGLPDGLSGRPLPTREPDTPGARDLVSVYNDFPALDWPESMGTPEIVPLRRLGGCEGQEPVYGRMVAWTRDPYRLLWFADHPAELYDLRWDPAERSNLVDVQPEIAAELTREVERFVAAGNLPDPSGMDPSLLAPELLKALRELGYIE